MNDKGMGSQIELIPGTVFDGLHWIESDQNIRNECLSFGFELSLRSFQNIESKPDLGTSEDWQAKSAEHSPPGCPEADTVEVG